MPDAPKVELRRAIWERIRVAKVGRFPGILGRIPNFKGAEAAAARAAELPVFADARVLKCNPDSPQRPLRKLALRAGKVLIVPAPKLAEESAFLLLDGATIPPEQHHHASSIKGAFELGTPLALDEVPPLDLIVTGVVGATRQGARLGKGGGYSDLEYGLLRELGAVAEDTPILTTCHPVQLQDELPVRAHDITLDWVVTPDEAIACPRPWARPPGILWDALEESKIESIPVLARRRP
jgi:5-formyltetrahydrofolate cyclo-ligase